MSIASSGMAQEAAPGSKKSAIGYPSVAAALEALKARSDVKISTQDGWTIVNEPSTSTLWSFTPPGHPAHPAAIKRAIVSQEGGLVIDMKALCQATKAACDKLMAEFEALNKRMVQVLRAEAEARNAPPSEIEVQRIGEDSFRLVLKSYRSRSVEAGQQELLPKAKEVCGGKYPGYGRHEFETLEPLSPSATERHILILKQDIRCGAEAMAGTPAPAAKRDAEWRPTAAQAQLVERQTYAYFAAKDQRRYQEAYAQLSATQKQMTSFDRWSRLAEDFNSKAGEARSRSIKKLTWYKDPAGAQPGVYAAADFSSDFANAEFHCGYVVWHEQPDGSFLLVREEQNFVEKAVVGKLKPGELEKIRGHFRC